MILAPVANVQTALSAPLWAEVKVIVSDTLGFSIPGARVTLTSVVTAEQFAAEGGEAKFHHIPLDLYNLEVNMPGFVTRKERVDIASAHLVLRVGLELGSIISKTPSELSVSIKPGVKGRRNLWIRLMPLYSSDLLENAVDSAGHFELYGMASGKYLLVLFENDEVLATKPVDVRSGKQSVELTLEAK